MLVLFRSLIEGGFWTFLLSNKKSLRVFVGLDHIIVGMKWLKLFICLSLFLNRGKWGNNERKVKPNNSILLPPLFYGFAIARVIAKAAERYSENFTSISPAVRMRHEFLTLKTIYSLVFKGNWWMAFDNQKYLSQFLLSDTHRSNRWCRSRKVHYQQPSNLLISLI